jgi:N-acetyl sugar amidotransferase
MDTTDLDIKFFGKLGCNHCAEMRSTLGISWFMDHAGEPKLNAIIEKIKNEGKGREYDSILGLSGGIDSAYVALKAFDWGLRPLVVHVDGGWNSELAVRNIQSILDYTGWELYTQVINWKEMQDLQLAYFKSGIANLDVPQDHAFFSSLYKFAAEHKIKYVLNGGNTSTEGIFPKSWHGAAMDGTNLRAIQKTFGTMKMKNFPVTTFLRYYFYYPIFKGIRPIRPLNFIPYKKEDATEELVQRIGYVPYARKHGESVFTKFFQDYFLLERFGIDKRLPHFSSLIVSGQLSRAEALGLLNKPNYEKMELNRDINYLCRKLRINLDEFEQLLNGPLRYSQEFDNWESKYKLLKTFQRIAETIFRKKLRIFS